MKIKKLAVLGSIMIFGLFSSGTAFSHDCYACAGRHREYTIKEMPEKINSEKIVSFNLKLFEPQRYNFRVENPDYKDKQVLAYVMSLKKKDDGSIDVEAKGGNLYSTRRDGSAFIVRFNAGDLGYTELLQQLVKKYDLIKDNGRVSHTDGLPSGDGDTLDIVYDTGERIYKNANNRRILRFEAAYDIYSIFKKIANDNGLDFNTAGSNVQLYDDPTVEWLQGTWKGKHFGREVICIFKGNHIQIYHDGQLVDDADYVIVDGTVKPAGKGAENGEYATFEFVTGLNKKNDFMLSGHLYKNKSSSSFEVMRQKQ